VIRTRPSVSRVAVWLPRAAAIGPVVGLKLPGPDIGVGVDVGVDVGADVGADVAADVGADVGADVDVDVMAGLGLAMIGGVAVARDDGVAAVPPQPVTASATRKPASFGPVRRTNWSRPAPPERWDVISCSPGLGKPEP
jgi:hypothetical protein